MRRAVPQAMPTRASRDPRPENPSKASPSTWLREAFPRLSERRAARLALELAELPLGFARRVVDRLRKRSRRRPSLGRLRAELEALGFVSRRAFLRSAKPVVAIAPAELERPRRLALRLAGLGALASSEAALVALAATIQTAKRVARRPAAFVATAIRRGLLGRWSTCADEDAASRALKPRARAPALATRLAASLEHVEPEPEAGGVLLRPLRRAMRVAGRASTIARLLRRGVDPNALRGALRVQKGIA